MTPPVPSPFHAVVKCPNTPESDRLPAVPHLVTFTDGSVHEIIASDPLAALKLARLLKVPSTFSLGPWLVSARSSTHGTGEHTFEHITIHCPEYGGIPIAVALGAQVGDTRSPLHGEMLANARLMAKAPELFAIAEQLLNLTLDENDPAHQAITAKARQVIAEAKGGK